MLTFPQDRSLFLRFGLYWACRIVAIIAIPVGVLGIGLAGSGQSRWSFLAYSILLPIAILGILPLRISWQRKQRRMLAALAIPGLLSVAIGVIVIPEHSTAKLTVDGVSFLLLAVLGLAHLDPEKFGYD